MRSLLIVLAGACASVGTSGLVWATLVRSSTPYCEVVQASLLRTTAGEAPVNLAVAEVMESARGLADGVDAEQRFRDTEYREAADAWFVAPDFFGTQHERVSRLIRRQVDPSGDELRVEVIRGVEMPTLVFVEHKSPDVQERVARQIADELAEQGVETR